MKKKFFMAACIAAAVTFSAVMPTVSYADEYYTSVDELAAVQFDSFEKANDYVTSLDGSSVPKGMEKEVFDYLWSTDGLFVYDSVSAEEITSILVTPTYAEICGSNMRLAFYHDRKAGESAYSEAETFFKNKTYREAYSAEKNKASGGTVYSYTIQDEFRYVWEQNGNYFKLSMNALYRDDSTLSFCNAQKLCFDEYGELQTKDGKLYFVKSDGSYANGWKTVDGKQYYFSKSGEAITKSASVNGVRYKFGKDGVCAGKYTGWTKSGGTRFYFLDGIKQKGWCKINDGWHYLDEKTGANTTGTVELYGKNYTFSDGGVWDGKDYTLHTAYNTLDEKLPKDIYGGAYNDDGVLVVMVKDREKAAPTVEKAKEIHAPIIMRDCAYSESDFEKIKDYLCDNMKKFNLNGVYTDVTSNRVGVTTEKVTDELWDYIDSLDDPDIIAVEYEGLIIADSDNVAVDTIECF